jgi:Tfp pilus assembly protein PilO
MLKSFNVWPPNNPRAVIRLVLGVLIAANLVAGYFVIRPIGGSPQELREQAAGLRNQIQQQQAALDRTGSLSSKIESGRNEGDQFMSKYFLPRRTAYSTIMADLNDLAGQTKVTPKEGAYAIEPIEGSDTLEMMQLSVNYEATYPDLIRFVNLVDKADRLLVVESLNATPQQIGAKLNIMLKLDTFVREDGSAQ